MNEIVSEPSSTLETRDCGKSNPQNSGFLINYNLQYCSWYMLYNFRHWPPKSALMASGSLLRYSVIICIAVRSARSGRATVSLSNELASKTNREVTSYPSSSPLQGVN
ncbi:hypothetical protein ACI65C_003479 [Semiaphis heraclei]